MNWTRTHTLAAGLGVIALTNAIALGGAAWNRSGEEARLRLTQRELHRSYAWYRNRENSGLSLALQWRVLSEPLGRMRWNYAPAYGTPAWLDEAKMRTLGFDTTALGSAESNSGHFEKQLPRDVLIVLELDGPTWQRFLERGRNEAASAEARNALERETRAGSRLFAVDAGLDAAALRAAYPDRSRYAIVRGEVRPSFYRRGPERLSGIISGISASTINVPLEFRAAIDIPQVYYGPTSTEPEPFEASVAFGKRLEPWIVEASRK